MNYINDAAEVLRHYWLSFLFWGFLLGMMGLGWKNGAIRRVCSLIGFIASVLITKLMYPVIQQSFGGNQRILASVEKNFQQYLHYAVGTETDTSGASFKGVYELFKMETLTGLNAQKAADLLVSIVLFVTILVIVNLSIYFVFNVMNGIMHLPVLNLLNRSAGAALGFVEGILYLWVFVALMMLIPGNPIARVMAHQLNESGTLPYYLLHGNLILPILQSFLH